MAPKSGPARNTRTVEYRRCRHRQVVDRGRSPGGRPLERVDEIAGLGPRLSHSRRHAGSICATFALARSDLEEMGAWKDALTCPERRNGAIGTKVTALLESQRVRDQFRQRV